MVVSVSCLRYSNDLIVVFSEELTLHLCGTVVPVAADRLGRGQLLQLRFVILVQAPFVIDGPNT